MSNYIIVFVVALILIIGFIKKVDIFEAFAEGVKDGLKTSVGIFAPLLALIFSINALSSSGFFDMLTCLIRPFCDIIGFPAELVPLALVKPFSGSGSVAILKNVFSEHGADSYIGKAASVMCAATETTFYTVSVYFGSVGIKKTAYTLPCALVGDFVTIALSTVFAAWF